ncbi:MAG: hypothetical protein ACK40G_01045 [Cytophagaceae bacterium]
MKASLLIPKTYLFLPLIFCFLIISSFSSAQSVSTMESQARNYMQNSQFYLALPIYLELDSLSPDNPKYLYPIGICYLHAVEEEKSLMYFNRCLTEAKKYPEKLYYYTAKANHLLHRFEEAMKYYEEYKEALRKKKNKKNKDIIIQVTREIEMCKNGKQMMTDSLKIKIVNLGPTINSKYPDHGPVLNADESVMIFTSSRPNTTGGMIDDADGNYYEDIYISYKNEDNTWSTPKSISQNINTNGHDASISLSADGQKLLLYKFGKEINGQASGDLYISNLTGTQWSSPEKLPSHINSKGWEPSACLSSDEKLLIFSSDREDGHGGLDLYMVKKLPNGEWALPMNMGARINTHYDEDSPFLHPDGKTLYFSSNGHKSMGGMDIFVTRFDEKTQQWSVPENVGYPISTAHDDMHFSWTADGRKVFFSSVRPGGFGDKDIYFTEVYKESAKLVVLKGMIMDSLSLYPVEATIKVTDNKSEELVGIFHSNSSTGKYIVILPEGKDYKFTITSQNYNVCSDHLDVTKLEEFEEIEKNIKLCPRR